MSFRNVENKNKSDCTNASKQIAVSGLKLATKKEKKNGHFLVPYTHPQCKYVSLKF